MSSNNNNQEIISLQPLQKLLLKKYGGGDVTCTESIFTFLHTKQQVQIISEYIRTFPITWEQYMAFVKLMEEDKEDDTNLFNTMVLCAYVGVYMKIHGFEETMQRLKDTYDDTKYSSDT